MTAKNDITGDAIATKTTTEAYRTNWDAIFGKKYERDDGPLTQEQLDQVKDAVKNHKTDD